MRNHVKLGVSLRALYCVVDTGYGLGIMVLLGLLGDVHKGNFTWNLKASMSSRVC